MEQSPVSAMKSFLILALLLESTELWMSQAKYHHALCAEWSCLEVWGKYSGVIKMLGYVTATSKYKH